MTTNILKDGLPLSPSRDLGHLFIPALRESFRLLDQVAWSEAVADLAALHGMTEQDLAKSVETFMAAVQKFTGNPEVTTIDAAFAASGFTATADLPRLVLFATLGEVLTAGFFIAVREMTFSGSIPPTSGSMAGMLAAGNALCRRLHGNVSTLPMMQLETAEEIETAAAAELMAARLRLDGLLGQLYNQRLDHKSISDDLVTVTAQMSTYRDVATTLTADVADLEIQLDTGKARISVLQEQLAALAAANADSGKLLQEQAIKLAAEYTTKQYVDRLSPESVSLQSQLDVREARAQALRQLLVVEQRARTLDADIARGEIQELKRPLWRKFLTGVMRLIGR